MPTSIKLSRLTDFAKTQEVCYENIPQTTLGR